MINDATLGPQTIQAPISFSASGDNVVIAGLFGKQIKVLGFFFTTAAATNIIYKSGSTPLSGTIVFSGNGSQVQDFIQLPLTCLIGDSFIMNSSNAVIVGGTIWYNILL